MSLIIHNSQDLRRVLVQFWATYNTTVGEKLRRTQLAASAFPVSEPLGPAVELRLRVEDVAQYSGYTVYGMLANEKPRSIVDELLGHRVWVGRGILASFGSKQSLAGGVLDRLTALQPANVLTIRGHLGTDGYTHHKDGRIHWEGVGRTFGDNEIYTAGFWWVLNNCQLA